MADKHPHAEALDDLGFGPVHAHFNITRRAWNYWRTNGVPKMHHRTIELLLQRAGKRVGPFAADNAPRERSAAA